ncbi:AraC family transcriptional regulator [Mesorhizobium sp. B2-4-15]|uniref:AraC family transcriptional regulator n=1 Tax=Mesorhizobium sp. B2-4-15 TaxID=2589934 RepID=UPI001FEEAAE6|nr:AraC family transcriptional regulator [Mesorhizobium sp. B2-4-15]
MSEFLVLIARRSYMQHSRYSSVPITLLIVPMDPLAALFTHVTPTAQTFFTGTLCHALQFTGLGHLHMLKAGELRVSRSGEADLEFLKPTLLFFPRGRTHDFAVDSRRGADLVCATVELGGAEGNPIALGLPECVVLPLAEHPALRPVCDLLVGEAFAEGGGRQTALDRLFEYLLILIVRHVIECGVVSTGVLAGLADPRLVKALTAIHEAPKKPWKLEELAEVAGMSRTRFAEHFRKLVGRPPIEYLTVWRITIARQLLGKGKPVKTVAAQVGYDSAAAFSRVFSRVTGHPPRDISQPQ